MIKEHNLDQMYHHLDYWRNHDKDCYLKRRGDGTWWFYSEWDNDTCWNQVTREDLDSLRNILNNLDNIVEADIIHL